MPMAATAVPLVAARRPSVCPPLRVGVRGDFVPVRSDGIIQADGVARFSLMRSRGASIVPTDRRRDEPRAVWPTRMTAQHVPRCRRRAAQSLCGGKLASPIVVWIANWANWANSRPSSADQSHGSRLAKAAAKTILAMPPFDRWAASVLWRAREQAN